MHLKTQKSKEANQLKRSFCQVLATEAQTITSPLNLTQIHAIEPTVPHITEVATTLKAWLADSELIYLFVGLARFYEGLADYRQAQQWYEKLLKIASDRLGYAHPSIADILNNIAALYYDQGCYQEAEPLYLEALELRQTLLGTSHLTVADSLNNLGNLYRIRGELQKAEDYLRRSFLIFQENDLEVDTVGFSNCINNLGLVLYEQEKYYQAHEFMIFGLLNRKKKLGDEHPYVANSLNNLGMLFSDLGQHTKAESYYLRALSIREKSLGENHPDVAQSLNNVGILYDNRRKYAKAESCYLRSLSIREKSLGENHPLVASPLHNLAGLYFNWGKFDKVKGLLERALLIRQESLGGEHPETQKTLNNLKFFQNNAELLQSVFGRVFLSQSFLRKYYFSSSFLGRILVICLGILILPFYTAWYLITRLRRLLLSR